MYFVKKRLTFLPGLIYNIYTGRKEVKKMKKIGRPKSNNPRNIRLEITLNKDEDAKLKKMSETIKSSKTSTLVKGLELFEKKRIDFFKFILPEEGKKKTEEGSIRIMQGFDSVGTLAKLTNKDPKVVQQDLIDSGLPKKVMRNFKCYGDQVKVNHEYDGIKFSVTCTITYKFQIRDEVHWEVHYDKIEILNKKGILSK